VTGAGWILTLTCADRVGIVAGVSGVLAGVDGFILDSQQYADLETGRFFMRLAFMAGGERFPLDEAALRDVLAPVADRLALDWQLHRADEKPRVMIAVSKGSHCLVDLLHRWRTGVLPIDIVGVVSNHGDLEPITRWHGVPYHHLPVTAETREKQEQAIIDLFHAERAELMVLARYMQVLSPALVAEMAGRCVNIHHSFLPSFKGAHPYERAHERGVKLIGATAHFVTGDLDEGPIIEQAVERVDHRSTAADLARIGRDVEAQVLARAVGWVAERRVFLNGQRTVVFR
jgi:formyltetrahydrofolate deformylase